MGKDLTTLLYERNDIGRDDVSKEEITTLVNGSHNIQKDQYFQNKGNFRNLRLPSGEAITAETRKDRKTMNTIVPLLPNELRM